MEFSRSSERGVKRFGRRDRRRVSVAVSSEDREFISLHEMLGID